MVAGGLEPGVKRFGFFLFDLGSRGAERGAESSCSFQHVADKIIDVDANQNDALVQHGNRTGHGNASDELVTVHVKN